MLQLLTKAFKGLSFKTKFGQFKTKDNPVLRIVGGVRHALLFSAMMV